ncbi:hypothetical protein Prum_001490 [Phytohabitans rumicis]|uniref:Uncharacterized protein n=1 Tax=Phytohabitans rumicis TaxID=1076125 RepID=A0A6V8KXE6_9ACTN|nr:hypothetical protein Prum_001490 [Phytohabitans rumicis]
MSEPSISQIITNTVKELRQNVPDCVAAGMVDMSTGMLLAVDTVDSHPGEVLDLLAAATFDMFQGRNVVMIEEMFNKRRASTTRATTSGRSWSTARTSCTFSSAVRWRRTWCRWSSPAGR